MNVCPLLQCELYHWVDVLDRFDEILEEAATSKGDPTSTAADSDCIYMCPKLSDHEVWWIIIIVRSTNFLSVRSYYKSDVC